MGHEPPVASASVEFQLSATCEGKLLMMRFLGSVCRGKVRTDVSMYAHLGIRVPAGICSGKLGKKVEYVSEHKRLRYLHSGTCFGSGGAIEGPLRVADYK